MVVAKNQKSKKYVADDYITYGNYALDTKEYDGYKKAKSSADKNRRERHLRQVKKQTRMMALVCIMFVLGVLIIGRYALIMNLNNQSRVLQNSVERIQSENSALNVELLKSSDIKNIESVAANDLHMVHPDGTNTVHIYVASSGENRRQSGKTQKVGIIERVMKLLD